MLLPESLMAFAEWIFKTSISAALVAGIIWLIQILLRKKISAPWRSALWLVLLLRLVWPFEFASQISLENWLGPEKLPVPSNFGREIKNINQHEIIAIPPQTWEPVRNISSPSDSPPPVFEIARQNFASNFRAKDVIILAWIAGTLILAFITLRASFRLWWKIRHLPPLQNPDLLVLFDRCREISGIRRPVKIVESPDIQFPLLFGGIRPQILLPSGLTKRLSTANLQHIFLHELAHLKRHDLPLAWLSTFLQILHWPNPAIWLAFYRMRADRALACDARVLEKFGAEHAVAYGHTLLNLLKPVASQPLTIGILENHQNLKRRIAMLSQVKKRPFYWPILAFSLLLGFSCLTITRKPEATKSAKEIVIEIGASDLITVNEKSIPLPQLGTELKKYQPGENTVIQLIPGDSVRMQTWRAVQIHLRNLPPVQTKYVNRQTGQVVVTRNYRFDLVKVDQSNLIRFEANGKFGFKNRDEEIVIPAQFDDAHHWPPEAALTAVKIDDQWGAIDRSGKLVIQPQFDEFQNFSEGLAVVKQNGKWGFVNTRGELVIKPQFDLAYLFMDGASTVRVGKKSGAIDSTAQFIIPPVYEGLHHFGHGLIPAKMNGKWGYLNKKNEVVIDFQFDFAGVFYDELARVQVNGRYGFINQQGEMVIPPRFMAAEDFTEGLAAVSEDNRKYGYIDFAGRWVIPAKYDAAFPVQLGQAWVIIFEKPEQNIPAQNFIFDKAGNVLSRKGGF